MSDLVNEPWQLLDWRRLLTNPERARMLDDIARVALALGRQRFPERPWDDLDVTARSFSVHRSPVERLWFIEQRLPALLSILAQIRQSPAITLKPEERLIRPPARARRVSTGAWMEYARRGNDNQAVRAGYTQASPDTPENQAVKAFLQALRHDTEAIGHIAESVHETEIAALAWHCAGALHIGAAEPFWTEVTYDRIAWQKPPTHRMLAHPVYAQAAQMIRQFRQSFAFDWSSPLFALPSRETWRLYEVWCLFQVADTLQELGYQNVAQGRSPELFQVKEGRLLLALMKGKESGLRLARSSGETVEISYNRAFPAKKRSLSRTMQPDITLERTEGTTERLWLLDPKFKPYETPGSEGDDIDQMHAYRDAILDSRGDKPVARAWCLYAGQANGQNRPQIVYGPAAESVVGALCLRPGEASGMMRLREQLAHWLT